LKVGEFRIETPKRPLRNPHCLAFLSPWVNSGNVAQNVMNRILASLGARPIGALAEPGKFYDFTRYRPKLKDAGGKREFEVPNTFLYAASFENRANPDSSRDIVILDMLEPHNLGERFNQAVFDAIEHLQIERYALLGSMYSMAAHTRALPISGRSFNSDIPLELLTLGVRPPKYQGATSLVSMLTERLVKDLGIEALSLIVNLPIYGSGESNDHIGFLRLAKLVNCLYENCIQIETADKTRAAEFAKKLNRIVAGDSAIAEIVNQLETAYDKFNAPSDKRADAQALSPEIQNFLNSIVQSSDEQDPNKPG